MLLIRFLCHQNYQCFYEWNTIFNTLRTLYSSETSEWIFSFWLDWYQCSLHIASTREIIMKWQKYIEYLWEASYTNFSKLGSRHSWSMKIQDCWKEIICFFKGRWLCLSSWEDDSKKLGKYFDISFWSTCWNLKFAKHSWVKKDNLSLFKLLGPFSSLREKCSKSVNTDITKNFCLCEFIEYK